MLKKTGQLGFVLAIAASVLLVGASAAAAADRVFALRGTWDGHVGYNQTVLLEVDPSTGATIGTPMDVPTTPRGLASTADGRELWVASYEGGQTPGVVSIFATESHALIDTINVPYARSIAMTRDGQTAWVAAMDGMLYEIDVRTRTIRGSILAGDQQVDMVLTPDDSELYVSSYSGAGRIAVIDTATRTRTNMINVTSGASRLAMSLAGDAVYYESYSYSHIGRIDTTTKVHTEHFIDTPYPETVDVAPNGHIFVASTNGGLWEYAADGTLIATWPVASGNPFRVATLPSSGTSILATNTQLRRIDSGVAQAIWDIGSNAYFNVIVLPNQPPVVTFNGSSSGTAGAALDLTATVVDTDQIGSVTWQRSDEVDSYTGPVAQSLTFAKPGRYEVTATAIDELGCGDASTATHDGRITRCNGSGLATATHHLTIGKRASAAAVTCTEGTHTAVGTAQCVIVVGDGSAGAQTRPTGTVTLSVDGATAGSCLLASSEAVSCAIATGALAQGPRLISAAYTGDAMHDAAPTASTSFARSVAASPVTPTQELPAPAGPVTSTQVLATGLKQRTVVSSVGRLRVPCKSNVASIISCSVVVRDVAGRIVGRGTATSNGAVSQLVVGVHLSASARRALAASAGGQAFVITITMKQAIAPLTIRRSERIVLVAPRVLVVPSKGMFTANSAKPTKRAQQRVRALAVQMRGARRVVCSGYTSGVRTTTFGRRLSKARAAAVCRLLKSAGVRATMQSVGRGHVNPIASNATAAGRERNRRVTITIYN